MGLKSEKTKVCQECGAAKSVSVMRRIPVFIREAWKNGPLSAPSKDTEVYVCLCVPKDVAGVLVPSRWVGILDWNEREYFTVQAAGGEVKNAKA